MYAREIYVIYCSKCTLQFPLNCPLFVNVLCKFGQPKIRLVEKLETQEGWSMPFPDEDWTNGFYQEAQDFMEAAWHNREPISGGLLGFDTTAVMYAAYVSAEERGAEVEVPREG